MLLTVDHAGSDSDCDRIGIGMLARMVIMMILLRLLCRRAPIFGSGVRHAIVVVQRFHRFVRIRARATLPAAAGARPGLRFRFQALLLHHLHLLRVRFLIVIRIITIVTTISIIMISSSMLEHSPW